MKKRITVIAFLLAALLAAMCIAGCGQKDEETFEPMSVRTTGSEKTYFDDDGLPLAEISIDAIELSGGGEGAAETLNAIFYNRFTAYDRSWIEDSQEATAYYREECNPTFDGCSYYTRHVRQGRSDRTVFVLLVDETAYSCGAAHGHYWTTALNVDPETGRLLSLNDLGVGGADPTDALAVLLAQAFVNGPNAGEYPMSAEEAEGYIRTMITEGDQWYLGHSEFVMISNPYDLASFADGQFEVTLNASELRGIIDEKWLDFPAADDADDGASAAEGVNYTPVSVQYYGEAEGTPPAVYFFGDNDGEGESNLIWWNVDVSDVRLMPVLPTGNGGFAGNGITNRLDSLSAGEAILLDLDIPEGFPNHCIMACVDGEYHTWLLTYDGLNGGIYFMEAELESMG